MADQPPKLAPVTQLVTVPEKSFRMGIDSRSAENQIQPGFVEDLVNGDIIEDRVRKRKGYQGYAGNVPVRVASVAYTSSSTQMELRLDGSIDLSNISSTPLVIYGKLSSASGISGSAPFTNGSAVAKYYYTFTTGLRKTLSLGTGLTIVVPEVETGIASTNQLVRISESTSADNLSHSEFLPDSITIDTSTYALTATYTNHSVAKNAIVYYASLPVTSGTTFNSTLTHSGGGAQTFTITTGTHGLSSFQIMGAIQRNGTGLREFITPDKFLVDSSGNVSITINSYSSATFTAILTIASKSSTRTVNANSTATVTIPNVMSPWAFESIYIEQTPGGTKEQVEANSIVYDAAAQTLTYTFTNDGPSPVNFFVYYIFGTSRSNSILITDASVATTATDSAPELTIWGLDHSSIYPMTASSREGWVTHIDSYRLPSSNHIICGLGGTFYQDESYAAAATTYKYATLYPRLSDRVGSAVVLGPLFYDTGETPARTRGYITGTTNGLNEVKVTSVQYDSGTGYTIYTLSIPSKLILDRTGAPTSLSSVISTTTGLEDSVIIAQMSNTKHEGTFAIKSIVDGTNQIQLYVANPQITSSDWDDTGVGGTASVFTDQIPLLSGFSEFLEGDQILCPPLSSLICSVVTNSTTGTIVIDGLTSVVQLPAGLIVTGSRTSSVLPMDTSPSSTLTATANLVVGDMLDVSSLDIARLMRVNYIYSAGSDISLVISGNGTTATATLGSGSTNLLQIGHSIQIVGAAGYSGSQVITAIPSTTTFQFSSTETATVSTGVLLRYTVEVDESFTWNGAQGPIQTSSRWIPIEAPTAAGGLVPNTHVSYLTGTSYNSQAFIRSCMVVSNMYFTNGFDPNFKFDGSSNYRSGLIDWQPGLFLHPDTTSSAKIVISNPTTTPTAVNVNVFTVPIGDQPNFPVGSKVRHTNTSGSTDYDIIASYTDAAGTNGYIQVRKVASGSIALGSSPTLTLISQFRYYFRLNAVDANSNVIASAVTGFQDHIVNLASDAAVNIKLVGLPVLDVYDYDKLQVQIYRTKAGAVAPFYLIATLPMSFSNSLGYLNYVDTYSDINLTTLDSVNSVLKGQELGTSWSDAPLAKYNTTLGNRLILGNLKSYPQLDLQLLANANVTNSTYDGKIFTIRKSGTATATDMLTTVRYQLVNGTTSSATAWTTGSNQFTATLTSLPGGVAAGSWVYLSYDGARAASFADGGVNTGTDVITSNGHGFTNGQQVQFTNVGGALPGGISAGTNYFIISATTNTFKISLTMGGSAVDITSAAGGGTHTATLQWGDLTYSGWWQVASVSGSTITVNLTGAAAATTYPDRYTVATASTDIPVLLGSDGNMGMVNGLSLALFDVGRRLSMAINASMRMVDTSVTGMGSFLPWITARGGNDVSAAGEVLIKFPLSLTTTPSILTPSSYSGGGLSFTLYVNGISVAAASTASALTKLFPSRIVMSYDNYPEIFDNPSAVQQSQSDSVIDVNSADGQEITGILPFFAESVFGAALQSTIVVVFKTNSIYLVDISQKASGANAVQRIETEGLGCTAPYSIAVTKNGICFANESGVYAIRKNLTIQYIGKFMERNWVGRVNRNALSVVQGHHYGIGRQYQLAVPILGSSKEQTNSEAFIYDHTQENESSPMALVFGAWGRYTNHPTTGWANLLSDAFMATTGGRVFTVRRQGDITDSRDDSSGIDFKLDVRANDFGDAGIRKLVDRMIVHYRVGARNQGTRVSTAADLANQFVATTNPVIYKPIATTGIDDRIEQDIVSLVHETSVRRGVYFQVRIENSTVNEDLEIAGVDYRVAGLSTRGIVTAAKSQSKP